MGVIDPQDVVSLDPRGLIGRIHVMEHYIMLHTKYIWFQQKIFPVSP